MDLKSILKKGEALLKAAHNKSASSDARMLLSYVLNCSKTFLFTHYDYQLTADEEARFVKLAELRAKGVPLQYITGQQEFMSLQFIVNPHVLIPRQETEILVETIIDYIKNIKSRKEKSKNVKSRCIMAKSENTGCKIRNIDCEVRNTDCKARNEKCIERNTDCSERSTGSTGCKDCIEGMESIESINYKNTSDNISTSILEIGTGSGCIAVSLAFYIQNCFITAVDISEEAIETAKLNASVNGVDNKINFIVSDLFENVGNNKFDIIVSNPPYISRKEIEHLEIEVKHHEPITALDGGLDGLDFYRAIIREAPAYLKGEGILAFEIGYNQAKDVTCLMEKYFSNVRIIKDLDKNDRVVIGGIGIERI